MPLVPDKMESDLSYVYDEQAGNTSHIISFAQIYI